MANYFSGGSDFPMGAKALVNSAWREWQDDANHFTSTAEGFLTNIQDVNVTPVDLSAITVDFSGISLPSNFTVPTAPTPTELEFQTVTIPDAPEVGYSYPTLSDAPTSSLTQPSIDYVNAPTFTVSAPDSSVDLSYPAAVIVPEFVYPDAPTSDVPVPPGLADITVPTVPELDLPTWSSTAPAAPLDIPDFSINFTEVEYSSTLLTTISNKVSDMIAGDVAIPDGVWDHIFNKAKENEITAAADIVQKATDEWANKGFSLPSGVVDRKIRQAREATFLKKVEISREIAVKRAEVEIENVKFAIQQGAALEGTLIDAYNKSRDRLIAIQDLTVRAATAQLSAQVQLFNAKVQAYSAEASVFGERVRAAVASLEAYRVAIEAEKLKLQKSDLDLEGYKARLQALGVASDIYRNQVASVTARVQAYATEVDARKSNIESERIKIEAAGLDIRNYESQVNAFKARTDAVSITNDNNKIKADVYKTLVQAFGEEISSYKSEADAKIAISSQRNQANEFAFKHYSAQLDAIKTLLQQEQTRVQSLISTFDGQSRNYSAQGQVLSTFKQAEVSRYNAQVSTVSEQAKIAAEKAKLSVEQVLRIAQLEAENAKVAAQVYGQVGAATLSGVGMTASIQDVGRASVADNYNENHNYHYEA